MAAILRRPRALDDLLEAWDYIASVSSEDRADAWLDRIDEVFTLLATNPKAGRLRPELMQALRSFPVGQYVIFYLGHSKGIDVVRVLHGARDIDASFFEEN